MLKTLSSSNIIHAVVPSDKKLVNFDLQQLDITVCVEISNFHFFVESFLLI